MNMGQMPSSGMGGPMSRTSSQSGPGGMMEGNPREHMMNQGQMPPHHLDPKVSQGNPSQETESTISFTKQIFTAIITGWKRA